MAPDGTAPPPKEPDLQAAAGRPIGMPAASFGRSAPALLELGYTPLPIRPGTKKPALDHWTTLVIDAAAVEHWSRGFPGHGIGLRTGTLVGLDIDVLDPDLAHRVEQLARSRLGDTLVRVGLWPKRLLLYRTHTPFPKLSVKGVEVLGKGQQFVAFGVHPDTGQPYYWPEGDTPLDVPFSDLPLADEDACQELLTEARAWLPADEPTGGRRRPDRRGAQSSGPVRDVQGQVIDGRDGWLSSIAYHVVHDALAAGQPLDHADLAEAVWRRFTATADVSRPRKDGRVQYGPADAAGKVASKLRLHAGGRLPLRDSAPVEAAYLAPTSTVAEARDWLDRELAEACNAIEAWHGPEPPVKCPQIGIRATVGLGKSVSARCHLLALHKRLTAAGAPSRIVVFTPSLALADEAAAEWRAGATVAVHRGYEAREPGTGRPMCRDIAAVRRAVAAGLDVHSAACASSGRRCCYFDECLKQANRREVDAADVIFASYDALFTGFHTDHRSVGLLLIDEGCWSRAVTETRGLWIETFAHDLMDGFLGKASSERDHCAMADLIELRGRAAAALAANGPGPLDRSHLLKAELTWGNCRGAALLEERRLRDPGLYPGMTPTERRKADERIEASARTQAYAATWRAMSDLLSGSKEQDGRIAIREASGEHRMREIVVTAVKEIHRNLRGKPVLHLDATLRPALVCSILPDLKVTEIDAAAPHMSVRLVAGNFGKAKLCQDPRARADENRRRANRLGECVDYVRWHAVRAAPGRVLVVTYKDGEAAFQDIRGVEVAHFNAVAGLDGYRDVRLLVIVGRPLPSEHALHPMCGAFFRHAPAGEYRPVRRGVRMRNGTSRAVRVLAHEDEQAEVLRAAICDDELIQAIGRGRGVNRTATNPLEVHVLADIALPLVHDRVLAWEMVKPDIVQRMLLAGIAVDSPADAAALHPELFQTPEQAEKAFPRAGFSRQNPIGNIYRELSVKSARYRRPGRGCSWQGAWWIEGSSDAALGILSRALGPLVAWLPTDA